MQCVHLLAFVLMKTFNLNIENRMLIQFHALLFFQVCHKIFLVFLFDFQQSVQDFFIIGKGKKFLQFVCIFVPACSDNFIQIVA